MAQKMGGSWLVISSDSGSFGPSVGGLAMILKRFFCSNPVRSSARRMFWRMQIPCNPASMPSPGAATATTAPGGPACCRLMPGAGIPIAGPVYASSSDMSPPPRASSWASATTRAGTCAAGWATGTTSTLASTGCAMSTSLDMAAAEADAEPPAPGLPRHTQP